MQTHRLSCIEVGIDFLSVPADEHRRADALLWRPGNGWTQPVPCGASARISPP